MSRAVAEARPQGLTDDQRQRLATKLTVVARRLWLDFDQMAEKIGLTRAKFTVVAEAQRNPGATQRTLAARLQVTDVTAGRLIDRLCAEGLLERHEDPEDRRAYRVYPLPPAAPMLTKLEELAREHGREAFAGLTSEQLDQFHEVLDVITRNLSRE